MSSLRSLFAAAILTLGSIASTAASALTLSTTIVTPGPFVPGQAGIEVSVVADEPLAVGSTDITLNWDLAGIQVDSATTTVLSSFIANIDNSAHRVETASAAAGTDVIPAGTPLVSFLLTANAAGEYALFITDGDGTAPDDLAGPVPPVPPASIPYSSVGTVLQVPEPSSSALMVSALCMILLCKRRARL